MSLRVIGCSLAALVLSLAASVSVAHVEEPDTIDMASINKEKTEVFLGLVQQLAWDRRTFDLLRRKLSTYEAFVLDGELQRRHPQTAGMRVTIEVAYFIEPGANALAELQQMESALAPKGIGLRWVKLQGER